MCVAIIFTANVKDQGIPEFRERVLQLGESYQYGICMGEAELHPEAGPVVVKLFPESEVIFQIHDLQERYCACDIDQHIRNGSRNGKTSSFFDFVKEVKEISGVASLSVLFYQEELPSKETIREKFGSFEEFIKLLNTWSTWQVEGFEPTRAAYFVADSTPLLYTFTDKGLKN